MCSTRSFIRSRSMLALGFAGMMLGGFGCQATVPPRAEKLNNPPLVVDDAMQRREWDRSISYYPNGDTVGGGTGYFMQTHETIQDPYRRVADPIVATGNIVALPVGVFVNSPFKPQVTQGAMIPPSHTVQPVLP